MRTLHGQAASPGEALGRARRLDPPPADVQPLAEAERPAALAAAREALAAAGAELEALGERLRAEGRAEEAEIVETGVLMAADPALDAALEGAVSGRGRPPAAALVEACAVHADAIAALADPLLAARADDVRSLGRRAARRAGARDTASFEGDAILVAEDLGPADVAELDERVTGIALAAGGPSAHAAVVARGLGIPMVVGVGPALLALAPGTPLALAGGTVVADPDDRRSAAARAAQRRRRADRAEAEAAAALPSVTADGHAVRMLVNAATAAEVAAGLRAGAEGVGLLRTELAFLEAASWPSEAEHRRALAPVLAPLAGRVATVRVLDFGADKTPPFLAGIEARGLALMLEHPGELTKQLRAIVAAAAATELRVLLPLVAAPAQVEAVRAQLPAGVALGAMIETRAAVAAAAEIAAAADFISIGTNDLTADVLGGDRFAPGAAGGAAAALDPRVLAAIGAAAAAADGKPVEVCGEAASEPLLLPLLVGLGVGELSVGAARVGATRAAVRRLSGAAQLARSALECTDAAAVAALVREAGDASAERLQRRRPVLALGPEP